MVGSTVPYSPFERSATRSKLYAHRYRYGMASFFITGAPPEFEDNITLRTCLIKKWNDPNCEFSKEGCLRGSLPPQIIDNASVRIRMCKQRPLLCALFFHNKLKILLDAVIGCTSNSDRRRSIDFLQHERHAFGQIASLNGVIEPQVDGRLHWHINLFSSVINPSLLTQLASAPQEIKNQVGEYIDSIVCTKLPTELYEWYSSITLKDNDSTKTVRAADLCAPTAEENFTLFMNTAQKKGILSGIHGHGFTCQKLPKGRYQCRVSMPRGVHEGRTNPILIIMNSDKNVKRDKKRPTFEVFEVDEEIKIKLSTSKQLGQGQLCHDHFKGPIVWEQQRFQHDTYFVEQNLLTTMLVQCHNNASFISGRDAGEAVEEYLISYFGKEAAPLKQAAGVLLAAMEHIHAYPSKADDKNTPTRNAKHLAQRTINSFSGGHQWSLPLMCSALLGHRSHISSDNYRYIFPHDNVTYVDGRLGNGKNLVEPPSCLSETTAYVNECLDALLAAADNNENKGETTGGTTSYRIKDTGKVVFLTQTVSYANRGDNFKYYSQLEFECIVELVERRNIEEEDSNHNKGRPKRFGFDLGEHHPLFTTHQGVIRCKMLIPILAGKPPPKYPGNQPIEEDKVQQWCKQMEYFSKYMIDMMVPWYDDTALLFPRDSSGFCTMAESWNSRTAPFICQQRYQYISNIMEKNHRNSQNEVVVGAWRERNCDRWSEMKNKNLPIHVLNPNAENDVPIEGDLELRGLLSADETYQFTVAITNPDVKKKLALQNISATYNKVFTGIEGKGPPINMTQTYQKAPIFMQSNNISTDNETCTSLLDMRNQIRLLSESLLEMQVVVHPILLPQGPGSVEDNSLQNECSHTIPNDDIYKGLTEQQTAVLNSMINSEKQQLIFMHGGGGTGKTFVTCRLVATLASRNQFCCCTCPTGVGASHLPGGRTFHSIFRTWLTSLSASCCIDEIARDLRGMQLRVLMIDEVSMLVSKFLVLLDNRLRSIYNPLERFGGISILLSGDFVQLPVIGGNDLWAVMYGEVSGEDATARELFSQFQVQEMTQQMRAAKCVDHRRRLERFRLLPDRYPTGDRWRAVDIAEYTPINDDIISAITKELTAEDLIKNPGWITDTVVLVSGNTDRAIINATAAIMFGQREGKQVYFWKRQLVKEIPSSLKSMLYDQSLRPLLFQYFVEGAPAQVLDNNNGNVSYGVANGTSCKLVSLAWDDKGKEDEILALVSKNKHSAILELPYPPDHIIVSITAKPGTSWPRHLNLAPSNSDCIHIPIGLVSRIDDKACVRLSKGLKLMYYKHAVDLAFAMSVWKGQGSTFPFVLALLEMSPGERRLTFEMLYVMFSRVQESDKFRCLPLTKAFNENILYNLRPSIGATRWRMDIGEDGLWRPNVMGKVKKSGKRFVKNPTFPVTRNKDTASFEQKPQIPKLPPVDIIKSKIQIPQQPPMDGIKNKAPTKTSHCSIDKAPKKDVLHFPNAAQSMLVQQQRMDGPNNERQLFSRKRNVYVADLDCLQNETWLYEHVIMMFLDFEHQHHENILLLDFEMYNCWLQRTLQLGVSYDHLDVMSEFVVYNTQIYQFVMWIVPIHENNHYQLLIITNPRWPSRKFFVLDSMKGHSQVVRNEHHLKGFLKCLLQVCSFLLLDETEDINITNLSIVYPKLHQQPNSYDCGVYTILNGIFAMKNCHQLLEHNQCTSLDLTHWYTDKTARDYRLQLRTVSLQQIHQSHLQQTMCIETLPVVTSVDHGPNPTQIEDCGTPWKYIHGDVINYFFKLMMEKYPHIRAQPTYFFQQLSDATDWNAYLRNRTIGNRCRNHELFMRCLQNRECTTILPMGANNHWTILVKRFFGDVWKLQFADSITSNSFSSLAATKRIFLNTPVCLNDEPIAWQNIHLQPQIEYECGARMCVAAVFLSFVDNNDLSQKIRCFNQIQNLSQKCRDMVKSICINKTFSIPSWLQNVISS